MSHKWVSDQGITESIKGEPDSVPAEASLEEIISLIKAGATAEIIYTGNKKGVANSIVIVCGDRFTSDVREIKPVLTTHSDSQLYIRSHDRTGRVTHWSEYFIDDVHIYVQFNLGEQHG